MPVGGIRFGRNTTRHAATVGVSETAAHAAIEGAVRESYGRLLAFLAARSGGDVSGAEDALGEAFLAALRQWPSEGVPLKPEAWLLAAARRRLIDMQRRGRVRLAAEDDVRRALDLAQSIGERDEAFPDERLKLLFVCAHPAIDAAARTPLMLQVVLGLDAVRIAGAFLVAPAAMSQRLVRAKTKIRAAGIAFLVPGRDALAERLGFVLDAIYAAYTAGWEIATEGGLATEAIWLARVLVRLMPNEPEAMGLLALVLHCESRRAARRDDEGRFVPLPEQDAQRWDLAMIHEAETALATAARFRSAGRFQLEAAIQSAHARGGEGANWEAIALLYEALVRVSPAWGARIGRAVALGRARGAMIGLAALDELPEEALEAYQPYWAARADLLTELARRDEARTAYARAIALSGDEATREFLRARAARLG